MPIRWLQLMKDVDARKRWSTWQPVAIVAAVIFGLGYLQFHVFPAQDRATQSANTRAKEAVATANQAKNTADNARQVCLDLRQKQIDANRELRIPLHKFSAKSAHAWDVIYKLFATAPEPKDETSQDRLNRARFLLALNEAYTAAQELERTVNRVEPVRCND